MVGLPLPHTLSASVNAEPLPVSLCFRLYVWWPPRAVSFSSHWLPLLTDPTVTLPLYCPVPVPFSMAWYSYSFLPLSASVMTCSRFGVPSFWTPPMTVSYARTGLPVAAQITLRGARSVVAAVTSAAFAAGRAVRWAPGAGEGGG